MMMLMVVDSSSPKGYHRKTCMFLYHYDPNRPSLPKIHMFRPYWLVLMKMESIQWGGSSPIQQAVFITLTDPNASRELDLDDTILLLNQLPLFPAVALQLLMQLLDRSHQIYTLILFLPWHMRPCFFGHCMVFLLTMGSDKLFVAVSPSSAQTSRSVGVCPLLKGQDDLMQPAIRKEKAWRCHGWERVWMLRA